MTCLYSPPSVKLLLIPSVSTQQLSVQCGMHKQYEQSVAIHGARNYTVMHFIIVIS